MPGQIESICYGFTVEFFNFRRLNYIKINSEDAVKGEKVKLKGGPLDGAMVRQSRLQDGRVRYTLRKYVIDVDQYQYTEPSSSGPLSAKYGPDGYYQDRVDA